MQVLVALADARGAVVTRDRLIATCWDGQIVGDDAINRAIGAVRRALREVGSSALLETVPKVGFRLESGADRPAAGEGPSRRVLIVASAAAAAAAAAAGLAAWRLLTPGRDPRVADLIERGRTALRDELPDSTQQGIGFFEEALRLAPDDAEAWGLLAIAQRNASEYAPPEQIADAVAAVERAAGRALAIDPDQPEALAAKAILPPIFGDWLAADRRLTALHARFPRQVDVIGALGLLAFSVGRITDAARYSALAIRLDPLSPIYQFRRAYHLWTLGRVGEADRTIDRALQLWPMHPAVRYARLLIFAGSDRPEQALAMIDSPEASLMLPPTTLAAWRAACLAMRSGNRADVERAVAACTAASQTGAGCINAILALNRIGALDRTFEIAEGYLLRRGPLVAEIGRLEGAMVNDQRWRKTMVLFTAATAPMRADPRFEPLVAELGLGEYWRASGTAPDYRRERSATA